MRREIAPDWRCFKQRALYLVISDPQHAPHGNSGEVINCTQAVSLLSRLLPRARGIKYCVSFTEQYWLYFCGHDGGFKLLSRYQT